MTEAYPLQWPDHWPRRPAHTRSRARFSKSVTHNFQHTDRTWTAKGELSIADALKRLRHELERLGARHPVISSNVELRIDGLPYSNRRAPQDPAVAIYFLLGGEQHCMPCDRWDRVADNIAAVAKHIEATRGIDRWGVGSVKAAFAGFKALPAPGVKAEPWRNVLDYGGSSIEVAEQHFRSLAKEVHPDRGGSHKVMAELNAAMDQARRELE